MKNDYLKDEGNALRVQKHQLTKSENKLSEIDKILSNIQTEQNSSDSLLDDVIADMKSIIETTNPEISNEELEENRIMIEGKIETQIEPENLSMVDEIDRVDFDENTSWNEYLNSIQDYSFKHNLNLEEDPFKHLMTKSQQAELQKRIKDEFSLKNAQCDKYDYMIAGTCGVIAGLIDILFVDVPKDSKLGNIADEQANKITEKFAEFLGWNRDKAVERGSNTTASAIGFLENKFRVNYDQAITHATDGAVKNLSLNNHHLKSLGHSPDIIGLIFSVLNQLTSTSSFISNGQVITIETDSFELQGHNFVAKIFCGIANWFGHIMSDWTGSSGIVGQGGRGSGVPIPFYNLLQMINVGEFGQHKQTFATITTKVFE